MLKKILVISSSLLVTPLGVAATKPFHFSDLEKAQYAQKAKKTSHDYPGFTGHWVGTCDGQPGDDTLDIESSPTGISTTDCWDGCGM